MNNNVKIIVILLVIFMILNYTCSKNKENFGRNKRRKRRKRRKRIKRIKRRCLRKGGKWIEGQCKKETRGGETNLDQLQILMENTCKNERQKNRKAYCPELKLKTVDNKKNLKKATVGVCNYAGANKNIRKTDLFRKICQPGCKESKITNKLPRSKYISEDLMKMWQKFCKINNKKNPGNINNCIEQRLYDSQCKGMPIIESTCEFASYYDIDKNICP
jgi:hypothetical protein